MITYRSHDQKCEYYSFMAPVNYVDKAFEEMFWVYLWLLALWKSIWNNKENQTKSKEEKIQTKWRNDVKREWKVITMQNRTWNTFQTQSRAESKFICTTTTQYGLPREILRSIYSNYFQLDLWTNEKYQNQKLH